MIVIRPKQPSEIAEAHRRADRRKRSATSEASTVAPTKNVEVVLETGNATYIHFRGRAFGVPPLPWKVGQRLTMLQARLQRAMEAVARKPLDDSLRAEYYSALAQIPPILWANSRPTGKLARLTHFIGLHANPFAHATDRELLELTDFFCSCRMRSGASNPPMMARPHRLTSSTT